MLYCAVVNYIESHLRDGGKSELWVGEDKISVLLVNAKDSFEAFKLVLDYYEDLHKDLSTPSEYAKDIGRIELKKIRVEDLDDIKEGDVVELFDM